METFAILGPIYRRILGSVRNLASSYYVFSMDVESQRITVELTQSALLEHINNGSSIDHSGTPAACVLCQKIVSPEGELNDSLLTAGICGDCKFLLLEDFGTPARDFHRRRLPRGRRMHRSSESLENLFSQMINLARHHQSMVSEPEDRPVDVDAASRLVQRASSHTTPEGSRRWRRVMSDTESDGFDVTDSLYGDSESTISFSAYRLFHGGSDVLSSVGDGSDMSVDGRSFLDTEIFGQSFSRSDLDSDGDIDPMHAGIINWDSDDHEEVEEDHEWEEADAENWGARLQLEISAPSILQRRIDSPELEGITTHQRIRESRDNQIRNSSSSREESRGPLFPGNHQDYLNARGGFEELLEHLAETESARRGAPPAALSFVDSLPRIVISDEHEKSGGLSCAICKDLLLVGTEANQLPCLHLYHASCILPWLSTRNSCPLCRYELPTDDMGYEDEKHIATRRRMGIHEIQQQVASDDSSSDDSDATEMNVVQELGEEFVNANLAANPSHWNGRGGRWFFNVAAPIISLVSVAFVLWFGNPSRGLMGRRSLHRQPQLQNYTPSSSPSSLWRNRRWWFF
ncbi:hypothetical protein Nepgr_011901 [Nepenthes gracilis]|uniref:RING-type E3 ubiquitin transferase n=1 Tax=Nepenthes gracilis TaxID=150966 RepID=A0AAD3SFX6_NEPGR|nr:hypothetical protein Nepgr_011901 [Nepenthes gracilis]